MDSLSSMKVIYKGDLLEFAKLKIVSEFDYKRKTINGGLDPLFFRNAETILLDTKDRIDEINDILRNSVRISDEPEIIEQVPILDPGRIVFARKTAQITNASPSVVD